MHFKKNRKGYVCGSFNKHGKKACSDHIIREAELANAILSDIKFMLSNIKNEKFISEINKKFTIDIKINELTKKEDEYKSLIAERFNTTLIDELDKLKEKIIDLKELTPEVLNRFVERIEVKADGTPKIFYRFSE